MKILVADDHPLIVKGMMLDLEELVPEAQITVTTKPADVLPLCREERFEVIFMDIDMPEISGIELARRILAVHPRTNIIYITGHEEYALESYETNASAFLLKPITKEKLRMALDNLRFPVSSITEEMLTNLSNGGDAIGLRIRKCREEQGFTREQFAELLNVSPITVFRWESGSRIPEVLMIMEIAKVLGAEPNDLLGAGH